VNRAVHDVQQQAGLRVGRVSDQVRPHHRPAGAQRTHSCGGEVYTHNLYSLLLLQLPSSSVHVNYFVNTSFSVFVLHLFYLLLSISLILAFALFFQLDFLFPRIFVL